MYRVDPDSGAPGIQWSGRWRGFRLGSCAPAACSNWRRRCWRPWATSWKSCADCCAPDFLERYGGRDPYRVFFDAFDYRTQLAGREPVKQILYLWLKSLFVNYNLAAERLNMAHRVEVRLPFLDHLLFEYGSRIPTALLA